MDTKKGVKVKDIPKHLKELIEVIQSEEFPNHLKSQFTALQEFVKEINEVLSGKKNQAFETDQITKKDIETLIKDHFKKVNIHLKLLKLLHELSLSHRNLERSEFEAKVKDFVGERDFYYIKSVMKITDKNT